MNPRGSTNMLLLELKQTAFVNRPCSSGVTQIGGRMAPQLASPMALIGEMALYSGTQGNSPTLTSPVSAYREKDGN